MITIKWDDECNVFVSSITLHSQGTTKDRAEEAILDAMESYVEVYRKHISKRRI